MTEDTATMAGKVVSAGGSGGRSKYGHLMIASILQLWLPTLS
jgi:hypothetical protein